MIATGLEKEIGLSVIRLVILEIWAEKCRSKLMMREQVVKEH